MDNSFYFDEVRCGFLIPSAVKQAWSAELEVLAEIDRICKKHDITYFAEWGTFLGTVRHGGFVPWDDDLDILMKREDLNRFLEAAKTDFRDGFHIQTFRNQNDYWLFMVKVVGNNHMCFEPEHLRRFHNFPYIACVDVFVLDYAHRDPDEEEDRRKLCKYIMAVADSIVEGRLTDYKEIRTRLLRIEELGKYPKNSLKYYSNPVEMGRYLYGLMEERFAEVKEEDADCLVQLFPQGLRGNKRHYPKHLYDDPLKLPFEYAEISVPRFYDFMLTKRYGNYGKFNKAGGAHDYPYFEGQKKNLLKVLDFDLPEFKINDSVIEKIKDRMAGEVRVSDDFRSMLGQALEELGRLQRDAVTLPDAQQLAIEMGNLIESVLGPDHPVIGALEEYCDAVFAAYESAMAAELEKVYEKLAAATETEILSRRIAVFMPIRYEHRGSLKPMWDKFAADPQWDVYLWPLTYYFKDYDGTPLETVNEADRWASGDKLSADGCGDFAEHMVTEPNRTPDMLALLHPDMIVIQDPYDEWNPNISVDPEMYASRLTDMTDRLVYLFPHHIADFSDKESREYHNTRYYVATPGVVYADNTYVGSEAVRRMFIERLTQSAGEATRGIWEQKIQVSPYQEPDVPAGEKKKKLVYGISAGSVLEHSEGSLKKVTANLKLMAENSGMDPTVCVYPAILPEMEELLPLDMMREYLVSEKDIDTEDYDGYYGDVIPVMAEFESWGKPVMLQNWDI